MAEVSVGDVVAHLRLNATDFTRQLQESLRALQQFGQALQTQGAQAQQTMQRGLQQNAQGFQALTQAAAQNTQSLSQNTQATQALSQQLGGLQQGLQRTTQAAQTFGSTWHTALAVAGGIGIATSIQGIVSAMVNFAQSTIQVGARMEEMRRSLGAIAGSSAAGVQQFNMLTDTAQRMGVAFEPLARGWRTLTAAASQTSLPLADQQRLLV